MSGGMLIPPGPIRVLVATKPVDFRKGMNGLAAVVQEQLTAQVIAERDAVMVVHVAYCPAETQ